MTTDASNTRCDADHPAGSEPAQPAPERPWLTVAEVLTALSAYPGDRIVYAGGNGDDFVLTDVSRDGDGSPILTYDVLTDFTACDGVGCEKGLVIVGTDAGRVTAHTDGTPACAVPEVRPTLTVDELILTSTHDAVTNGWRLGQAYFNTLYVARPDLADRVRATACDPFNNDAVVPRFIEWAIRVWDLPADEVTV